MTDLPPYSDSRDDTGACITRRPRWVYAVGVGVILLVVLMVVLHLTGKSPAGVHQS